MKKLLSYLYPKHIYTHKWHYYFDIIASIFFSVLLIYGILMGEIFKTDNLFELYTHIFIVYFSTYTFYKVKYSERNYNNSNHTEDK